MDPSGGGQKSDRTELLTKLQFAFAVFAVVNTAVIFPGQDAILPLIQSLGAAGYALAAVFSLYCGMRFSRPGVRKAVIWFHIAFIPVQFIFSFPGPLPLLGMAFSAVIAVLMRPVFPKLSPGKRKFWVTLHVGLSVGWLGISVAMIVLSMVGLTTDNAELRHGAYELMHTFDLVIVIPTVVLSVITGLVVSLGGKWGLAKHRWVLAKLVISLSIPAVAIVESQWVQELAARTADPAAEPGGTGLTLAICMVAFAAALWTATWLSVAKPGGRTRWGKRDVERERAARTARAVPVPRTESNEYRKSPSEGT